MSTKSITERLDDLIDELLLQSDIRSSSLVSMLSVIRESVTGDYHVALARHVWDARNLLEPPRLDADAPPAEAAIPVAALAK